MRAPLAATILLLFAFALFSAPTRSSAIPSAPDRSGKPAAGEKKLPWLAFDAATEKAKKENKHMVVDIYTTWCGWCKVMDRQTYGNKEVASYLTENFVLAKVNGESSAELHWKGKTMTERQFARAIGVTGFPTTYFLKPDAEIIGGAPGFIGPENFIIYAKYVSTKWYEKGSPQEYLKATASQAEPQPSN
jgi:thioredoxin-related protein